MRPSNITLLEPTPATTPTGRAKRVLVVLNSLGIGFYGLERQVIETFDALRPSIDPVILIPQAAARYRTPMYDELQRRGFALRMFSDTHDWPRIGKPASLREAFGIARAILRANRDVWREAREADCIYVPILSGLYFSLLASLRFKLRNRRVVYGFHDLLWNPSLRLQAASYWVSDFVHLTGSTMKMAQSSNPAIMRRRNHVIPPVLDFTGRARNPQGGVMVIKGRGIVFAGQVARHKGIDLLLEAFRQIAPRFPDVTLHIAGGAAGEYGEQFSRAHEATGLGSRIRYWGYLNDVEPLLRAGYIYVHPSLPSVFHEAFGNSAVEALSVGTPIVCFRSGALAEIVQQGETGLICETESAACLAENLAALLSDPAKRGRFSQNCVRQYQEHFSKETIQQRWRMLLQ